MINLSKAQVSWESQVIAFKWHQNIGDALAHFSSFLSEAQRQEAFDLIPSYTLMPNVYKSFSEEFVTLKSNIEIAPIKADRPTLIKTL